MKIIILILAILFFTSCSNKQTQIKKADIKTPQWYLTPPLNNSKYLYGVGSGKDRETSIKSALDDMISKLGISIESSFESSQKVSKDYREYISNESNYNIKSYIDNIRISNYETIDTKKLRYNNYISLVRSDKNKFTKALISSLDNSFTTIQDKENIIKNDDPLKRYYFYQKSSKELSKISYKLLVLNSLDSNFVSNKYLSYIKKINKHLFYLQNDISFFILNNSGVVIFENILKKYLTSNFNLSNKNTNSKNKLKIYLSHSVQYSKSNGFIIANVLINMTIKDYMGNTIKTQLTEVTGYSVSSREDSLIDASLKYSNDLKII